MTVIRTLDLFSGIGGFAVALKEITDTVGYCDVAESCRKVIANNIRRGILHDAPIFQDVKKITSEETYDLKPELITAGFPCTDISIANVNGEGIKGERSGLFYEIMRIVDQTSTVQALFLENSHAILKRGFPKIMKELNKRGFKVVYCITTATDVGALHRRKRWYCLCFKPEFQERLLKVSTHATKSLWSGTKEPCSRMVPKPKAKERKVAIVDRCKMLGNAIVPQCAAHAWNSLVTAVQEQQMQPKPWRKGKPLEVSIKPLRPAPTLQLEITDGKSTFHKKHWATPCYSIWHIYSHITSSRAKTVLTVQMFYEKNTQIENKTESYRDWLCNPRFIEYLMGYSKDWTLV